MGNAHMLSGTWRGSAAAAETTVGRQRWNAQLVTRTASGGAAVRSNAQRKCSTEARKLTAKCLQLYTRLVMTRRFYSADSALRHQRTGSRAGSPQDGCD